MTYRKLWLLLAIPVVMSACSKAVDKCPYVNPTDVATVQETTTLKAYLDANSITYVQHPNGFFYTVVTAGTGATADVCKTVNVKYTGRLLNGTVFDSNTDGANFQLGGLIKGWQLGIPLVKAGGTIKLYIPPSLAYGNQQVGTIPANSYMIFDIQLVSVN